MRQSILQLVLCTRMPPRVVVYRRERIALEVPRPAASRARLNRLFARPALPAALLLLWPCALALSAAAPPAPEVAVRAFRPTERGAATLFGYAVAATPSRVIVGAPHASVGGRAKAGAVHVFDASSG